MNWELLNKIAIIITILWVPSIAILYFKLWSKIKEILKINIEFRNKIWVISNSKEYKEVILYKCLADNLKVWNNSYKRGDIFIPDDSLIYSSWNSKQYWKWYEKVIWNFLEIENISNFDLNIWNFKKGSIKILSEKSIPFDYINKNFVKIINKYKWV